MDDARDKKKQEEQAAGKVADTALKGVLAAKTGGAGVEAYEKLKKTPIVGKKIEKKLNKAGKKANKLSKGKFGKAAKKLDDSGLLDTADKAISAGSSGAGTATPNNARQPNNIRPTNKAPTSGVNQTPKGPHNRASSTNSFKPAPNLFKDGIPSNNTNVSNNGNGAISKNLNDIYNRRKNAGSGSSKSDGKSNKSPSNLFSGPKDAKAAFVSKIVDEMVKKTMLPFLAVVALLMMILLVCAYESEDNDLAAVDKDSEQYGEYDSAYYSNQNKAVKEFYDRVKSTEQEYSKNGKSINMMYITATYHVLKEYNAFKSARVMDQDMINTMADGMLNGSSVYSEDNYRQFLKNEFFPNYISSDKIDKAVDRVFEYINQYMEKFHPKSGCSSYSGSSCIYKINGVHGFSNSSSIDVTNLQVRLMSSSFCNGVDGKALDEDLVPFEDYVLGVTYGEIGQSFAGTETEKVHMIAARSFALARPTVMGNSSGVKYVNNNGQNILQLRSCVADQVFCNTELGCSKDVAASNQYGIVYSGATSHPYTYKEPLSNYPNSTLKSSWQATVGMIGVDENDKVVEMGYAVGNGNKDDWVWKRWEEQGMDYVEMILKAYPEVKKIKKMDCNSTEEKTDTAILTIASRLFKKVANGNYSYGSTSIPPNNNLIDCSSFVSWVLYEYGFKDEFGGNSHDTTSFMNTDWTKNGWAEIKVAASEDASGKLKAGDILVRDDGSGGANGHISIIAEVKTDGTVLGYDCGSVSNWSNDTAKNGKPIDVTSFVRTDSRNGKIIRVSNVSGDSCISAESGDALNWKQYDVQWKSIPLGNSSANIGGYGCFITSIAIQIARSNATTTLSNFNPGSFVKELNKYSGSFSSGGSFMGANIDKIVPGFSEKYHAVSLSGNRKNKAKQVQSYLDQGLYPIMRVKTTNGEHWVAVVGTSGDEVIMADPGSENTRAFDTYSVGECSTLNVYQIG